MSDHLQEGDGECVDPFDEGAESAWTSEVLRRLEEIEDGSVQSVDGRSSLDLARKQLAARRR